MATTLEELQLKFTGNTSALNKSVATSQKKVTSAFGKMKKSAGGFGAGLGKLRGGIGGLAKAFGPLLAALAGAVSIMKIYAGVNESFDRKDALGKTADKLGLTTEALAGLNIQAEKAGTTTQNMEMSLQRMNRRMSEAAEGSGTAKDRLEQFGLSAEEMIKLSPDKAFALISDEINKLENAADKTAAAFDIFGLSGAELIKVMEGGSAAIAAAREEAKRFGTSISRLDAAGAEVVNDAFTDVKLAMEGVFNILSTQLAPAFFALAKVVTEFAIKTRENQKEVTSFGDIALMVVGGVATGIHAMLIAWEAVKTGIIGVRLIFAEVMSFQVNILTDFVSRLMGFSEIAKGIMEDPKGAWEAAWLGMEVIVKKVAAGVLSTMADLILVIAEKFGGLNTELGSRFKLLGETVKGAGLDMNAGAEIARAGIADLVDESEGLKKIEAGFAKVTAAFDPTKAKTTGIDYIDGVAAGFEASTDELSTKLGEQLGTLAETANMFGGQTAFAFVQGMGDEFKVAQQAAFDALPGKEDGDGPKDPLEDERVIREKLVQEEIGRFQKDRIDTERKNEIAAATFYKSNLQNKLSVTSGILGNLASLMQSKSRKMFEIGKAAAIGQAIVDTWAAANKSMASLPFPVNIAAAAATATAGFMNVQSIRAQKFGGGGSGGGASSGASSALGAAAGAAETAPPPVQQTRVNINLQGNSFGGNGVRGLIEEINEATDDNTQLMATMNGATT